MSNPTLQIKRYEPRNEKEWKNNGDGSTNAKIYTDDVIVEVFTYPGGQHGGAFTHLELFIYPHMYYARLPRHYHSRWLRRLAYEFAWQCAKQACS